MKQLTLRGFDPELERLLLKMSEEEGLSLNQAALKLMREGAGLRLGRRRRQIGSGLDRFIGTMSEAEGQEILAATEVFQRIDGDLWE